MSTKKRPRPPKRPTRGQAERAFDRMVEAVRAFAAAAYPCSNNVIVALDAGPWHSDVVIQVVGDNPDGLHHMEDVSYVRRDPEDSP